MPRNNLASKTARRIGNLGASLRRTDVTNKRCGRTNFLTRLSICNNVARVLYIGFFNDSRLLVGNENIEKWIVTLFTFDLRLKRSFESNEKSTDVREQTYERKFYYMDASSG